MDETTQGADSSAEATNTTTETGNHSPEVATTETGTDADLAVIAAAGRGEASSHEAFAALHRLVSAWILG